MAININSLSLTTKFFKFACKHIAGMVVMVSVYIA
jgi:hypothetical protein